MPVPTRSLHRRLVDQALTQRGTTLEAFIAAGKAHGKSTDDLWADLRQITDVPFSPRTLYRWVQDMEIA